MKRKFKLENEAKLGRPGVTYKDVSAAMKQLVSNKTDPTLRRLREMIGHGGVTTISKYRAKYLLEHPLKKKASKEYINGYREAFRALKVFIQDNGK